MAIRRSINKRKMLWYHRKHGSVDTPPFGDMGATGKSWPNGSAVTVTHLPRHRGQSVVIGWICYLDGLKLFGMYVCTKVGVSQPAMLGGNNPPELKKGQQYISPVRAEDGTYKLVECLPETTPFYRMLDKLVDAYADHHDVLL